MIISRVVLPNIFYHVPTVSSKLNSGRDN